MEPDQYWRLPSGSQFDWRKWDDDCVVFNPHSGSTHLLSEAGAAVLFALRDAGQPMTIKQMALYFSDGANENNRADDLTIQLETSLAEFERIGLVERLAEQSAL